MSGEGEFGYIRRRLAPLTRGFAGAFDLTDDAAEIAPSPGCALVLTADTLVAGRHFPEDENPALAARKALRANLSDLAAMGAKPVGYLASVVWPLDCSDALKDGFADGLQTDGEIFGLPLIGGDTTAADGPWTIAITAIGEIPAGRALRRSGARPGDILVVTGEIGDAGLGLDIVQGRLAADMPGADLLLERLRLPIPRLDLAHEVRRHAHAGLDVSDGLIADAGHIAAASGLALEIELDDLPLSDPARSWLDSQADPAQARLKLARSGDDYELALAVPPESVDGLSEACAEQGLSLTVLGRFTEGQGVSVRFQGRDLDPGAGGFTHF